MAINDLDRSLPLLISLIPFSLIVGTGLININISLICLLFILVSAIQKKNLYYFRSKFFIFFSIWWICIVISSLTSIDKIFSLSSSLPYIRYGILVIAVWYTLEKYQNFKNYFTISLTICFILVLFDSYFQFFSGSSIFGTEYVRGRLSSVFGDELIAGSYLSRLYPLLIGLVLLNYSKNKIFLTAIIISLILIDLIIFLSGERVAFFNLIISSTLIIVLINKWKKVRLYTFIASLILIFIISSLNSDVKQRMVNHTLDQVSSESKIYIFSEEHQNFYEASLKMFLDRPIFGHGPKMYRNICRDSKYFYTSPITNVHTCSTSPHGVYPQLLAETGIAGTIFVIYVFLYISFVFCKHLFLKLRSSKSLNDYQICILTAVFISLWPIIPSGNFFSSWISTIYFLPIGFILHSLNSNHLLQTK